MGRYTEQELRDIFYDALDFFNEALDSGITRNNTILAFFTSDNGLEVYKQFCGSIFRRTWTRTTRRRAISSPLRHRLLWAGGYTA